MLAVDSWKSR